MDEKDNSMVGFVLIAIPFPINFLQNKSCEYFASWEYNENTDKINFTIISGNPNKWTGIGRLQDP